MQRLYDFSIVKSNAKKKIAPPGTVPEVLQLGPVQVKLPGTIALVVQLEGSAATGSTDVTPGTEVAYPPTKKGTIPERILFSKDKVLLSRCTTVVAIHQKYKDVLDGLLPLDLRWFYTNVVPGTRCHMHCHLLL